MKKVLGLVFVWTLVLGGGAAAYHYLIVAGPPSGITNNTKPPPPGVPPVVPPPGQPPIVGGGSKKIKLALDSFSGYCIFRSPEFTKRLAAKKIEVECVDDKAVYPERMKTVMKGETPLAVFTIDALLKNAPKSGEPPTIIMVIDETRGADAMVAYKDALPDIDALNNENAKVVLTPDSPSEMLLRVVRNSFKLSKLPEDPKAYQIPQDGADKVLGELLTANRFDKKAFVLWEPYVSLALAKEGIHVLADSSRFRGYIVDVLVAQPDFLRKNKEDVKTIVQTYLEVLHAQENMPMGMVEMVRADMDLVGESKNKDKAGAIARGIQWKNTVENFALFGLQQSPGVQSLEGMVKNIRQVLEQTGKKEPPLNPVRPDKLVDNSILTELKPVLAVGGQTVRRDKDLPALPNDQWTRLKPVATVLEDLEFVKGTFDLTGDFKSILNDVAETLKAWPNYYLEVEGNTRGQDTDLNRETAQKRATTVTNLLINEFKIPASRLRAVGKAGGGSAVVKFRFLQGA